MSRDPYPSTSDLHDLARAHHCLTAHGIPGNGATYDVGSLAAAVYDHGWTYRIDRATGMSGYEAEIQRRDGVSRHRAMGWEPSVALAFALSMALEAPSD